MENGSNKKIQIDQKFPKLLTVERLLSDGEGKQAKCFLIQPSSFPSPGLLFNHICAKLVFLSHVSPL